MQLSERVITSLGKKWICSPAIYPFEPCQKEGCPAIWKHRNRTSKVLKESRYAI